MGADERSYVLYAPTPWAGPAPYLRGLAEALAARHAVLYVDPPISPLSPFRYGLGAVSVRQLQAVAHRGVRSAGERLGVFSPLALPRARRGLSRALSQPLLRSQISRAVRSAGLERPVVVASFGIPQMLGAARESLRVGMLIDHPSAGASLMGRDAAELDDEASALCRACDLAVGTSRPIVELLSEWGCTSALIPAGFPSSLAAAFDRASEPPEYATLPRPLLGYTGGIDDRLDFELILRLADRFSHGSIVFVGFVSPRLAEEARAALAARANIHLLGPRPQVQLSGYIRYLDVALLPYEDSLFTRYQAPVKLWEYLYAGPPIVGTGSVALRGYAPALVNYAESADAAVTMVEQALADPDAGREDRRRFALANTWEHRAGELDALVDRHTNGHAVR